jgi:hypothetical protein
LHNVEVISNQTNISNVNCLVFSHNADGITIRDSCVNTVGKLISSSSSSIISSINSRINLELFLEIKKYAQSKSVVKFITIIPEVTGRNGSTQYTHCISEQRNWSC